MTSHLQENCIFFVTINHPLTQPAMHFKSTAVQKKLTFSFPTPLQLMHIFPRNQIYKNIQL